MSLFPFRLSLLAWLLLVLAPVLRGGEVGGWDIAKQGGFVISLCASGECVWAGTEGSGLWRRTGSDAWERVPLASGADQTVASIAEDGMGRLWVGHGRSGVSVLAGTEVTRHQGLNGALGSRVHCLEYHRGARSMLVGHECGLSRYDAERQAWDQVIEFDGVSALDVVGLATTTRGSCFVLTQFGGMFVSDRGSGYRAFRRVPGLDADLLLAANRLVALGEDSVLLVTGRGLAVVEGGGTRVRRIKQGSGDSETALLRTMYATDAVVDGQGRLLVGTRQQGLLVFAEGFPKRIKLVDRINSEGYVRALCMAGPDRLLIGWYGDGFSEYALSPKAAAGQAAGRQAPPPPLAVAAAAPGAVERQLAEDIKDVAARSARLGGVIPLAADWRTRGDWLGRLGRDFAMLCAVCSPDDYEWGVSSADYHLNPRLGARRQPGDRLRAWVHWLETSESRCLELPPMYLQSRQMMGANRGASVRRQAEWDDHGEEYPMNVAGPDVEFTVDYPEGWHVQSMYFVNKDGHDGMNRYRDYLIRVYPSGQTQEVPGAAQRVVDFYDGVYRRYAIRGPAKYRFVIERNNSFNTIISSVFIDRAEVVPSGYYPGELRPQIVQSGLERLSDAKGALGEACRVLAARGETGFLARSPALLAHRLREAALGHQDLVGLPRMLYGRYACDLADEDAAFAELGIASPRRIQAMYRWDRMSQWSGRERDAYQELLPSLKARGFVER